MNRQPSETDKASNQLLGEPISTALDIQPGGAQRDAEIAVKAIESIHTAVDLPRIRVITNRSEAQIGGSLGAYSPVTKEILVASDGPWPALTTAHEIGHFIDNQSLAGDLSAEHAMLEDRFASFKHGDLDDWRRAAEQSAAIEDLRAAMLSGQSTISGTAYPVNRAHADYCLQMQEIFARSYAQYIATRSQDAVLLKQLNAARAGLGSQIYHKQWDDDDFVRIAQAFDELFEAKKWLLKHGN